MELRVAGGCVVVGIAISLRGGCLPVTARVSFWDSDVRCLSLFLIDMQLEPITSTTGSCDVTAFLGPYGSSSCILLLCLYCRRQSSLLDCELFDGVSD